MAEQWFYIKGGTQHGPVEATEIKRLASQGELRAMDYVWREGEPNWERLGSVPGLMPPPVPGATAAATSGSASMAPTPSQAPALSTPPAPSTSSASTPSPSGAFAPLGNMTAAGADNMPPSYQPTRYAPTPAPYTPRNQKPFPLMTVLAVIFGVLLVLGGVVVYFFYAMVSNVQRNMVGVTMNMNATMRQQDPDAVLHLSMDPWSNQTTGKQQVQLNQAQGGVYMTNPAMTPAMKKQLVPNQKLDPTQLNAQYPGDVSAWPTSGQGRWPGKNALKFDGQDYLVIKHHNALNFNQQAMTLLVSLRHDSKASVVLSKCADASSGWELGIKDDRVYARVGSAKLQSDYVMGDGAYHIIVLTLEGGSVNLAVDGRIHDTVEIDRDAATQNNTADLFIGKQGFSDDFYFKGEIDEIGVFHRAFTVTELQDLTSELDVDE